MGDVVDGGQNFIWMKPGYTTEVWCRLLSNSESPTSVQTISGGRHDYVLTATYSSGKYTLNLYQDGVAATPITNITAGSAAWKINAILNGYATAGYSFYGQFEYLYIWSGRARFNGCRDAFRDRRRQSL